MTCRGYAAGWILTLLLASVDLEAQQPPGPAQPVDALVPRDWAIEQRHGADFNGDGRRDALLLIRRPGAGDTPPRMIVVALARPAGGFTIVESNARLIPVDISGQLEDPMADGELIMRPAGFDLSMGMLPTVGSYQQATIRYRFRFDGRCFRLVAYDRLTTDRATLDTADVKVSLLTGQVVRTTGNAERGTTAPPTREPLRANRRYCLADLGNGWTFDPTAAGAPGER